MKTIKTILLSACMICFALNLSSAQQYFHVHQDNVKPSRVMEYEEVSKEFVEACKKHKPDTEFLTVSMDDFTYYSVTPITSLADLEKNPFSGMSEAMGDDMGKMMGKFNKCYDSHGDYVINLVEDLTYMPEGVNQAEEGMDYRNYYFIYYTPENSKKMWDAMKAVKDMFAEKGSNNYYRVYRSAFGNMDSYYMVAMSSKNSVDSAQKQEANKDVLGPGRHEVFQKVLAASSDWREVTGHIRRDLSYRPEKS